MKDKCKWFKFILVHLFWILHPRTDKAGHQNNYIFMLISQYCTFLLVMQCSVMCHTFSFEDFFPNINILTSPCDIVSCDLICSELPHLDVWPPQEYFLWITPVMDGYKKVCGQLIMEKSIYLNSRQKWIFFTYPEWRGATQDYFFLVRKYSFWSLSCRNIYTMVYCAKILVRYRYVLGKPPKQIFGKSWDFGPRRGGGSDPIPTFFQNWPKPNLPWNCP